MRGDLLRAAANVIELARLTREHDLPFWRAYAAFLESLATAESGAVGGGLDEMRRCAGLLRDQNDLVFDGLVRIALANAEAHAGDVDRALAVLDEALTRSERIGHRTFDAELNRVRGEILLKRDPASPAPAEEAFRTAIAVAKRQATRSFELRSALALAKLYQSIDRPVEAHAVLAPALEDYSRTPEMPDIAEADALLAAVSQTDQVTTQTAQTQRLKQLRVAYGNALFALRPGAQETSEAFAKARRSAYAEKGAPEQLAAEYGLWAGSYSRGELSSMRAYAEAFLNDVAARPNSPEAGVAHRIIGVTSQFAGEFVEACDHLERALALFEPGRDDDLAYRFGFDVGVAAMANLAISTWALGDVERAISLSDRAQARLSDTHTGTRAFGNMLACVFHMMRRDKVRAASNALEVARLAREHDLTTWRAFGVYLESWATAENGDPEVALRNMHRGAELLREQNMSMFDGLFKIALAEVECRAGDLGGAVAILDEALVICESTGQRAFESELHRVRAELLLERDPANLAPAEETCKTAIAVAHEQGARSFELRAAPSLAKLYRSTRRPAEAHAVLAPALEGFSPTPEMPETAEAQSLLGALAETEEVKAAVAQLQRRLHLQTAYGQALMYSKGFVAGETRTAFARAAELATRCDDFSERFAAAHGQWTQAIVRGELKSAREMALPFLREAEDKGRAVEAGVAHRGLARICYFAGDFAEARTHCERALAACDPEHDREARERFGEDTGTGAMSCLAQTCWELGEVERARELIEASNRRAIEVGHAPSMAHPLFRKSRACPQIGDSQIR
jgi:tetratricopeptide (TPR) repeat protein